MGQTEQTEKIEVKLIGEDGNAFFILGKVSRELRRAGYTKEQIDQYLDEAKSGDYDKLLQVTMKWVDIV